MAARGYSQRFIRNGSIFIRILAAYHFAQTYIGELAMTGGLSMLPTLNSLGDHVYVDKLTSHYGRNVQRGDVIIFSKPTEENVRVCKRVVGLPGDIVYSNEMPGEPHSAFTKKYIRVPAGHLWVLGDNSSASMDSREYGPIPMGLVAGKVQWAIYWGIKDLLPHWPRKINCVLKTSSSSVGDIINNDN
ncbi:peptidase S24/S26A/S26B/S26C [Dipodascopsis uninucleata]